MPHKLTRNNKQNRYSLSCFSVPLCLCGLLLLLLQGCATSTKGTIKPSDSPYDLAIDGEGFFIVESGQGGYFFTRRGNLAIDSNRFLVTHEGYRLAPSIQIPEINGVLKVSLDGKVIFVIPNSNTVMAIGNIRLALFTNPAGLEREGNYFLPTASSGDPVTQSPGSGGAGTIRAGFIEN